MMSDDFHDLRATELAVMTAAFGAAFANEYRRARDANRDQDHRYSGPERVALAADIASDHAAQISMEAVKAFRKCMAGR